MESELIEYPDLSACYVDSEHDRLWMVLYLDEKEIHILLDPWEFLQVIDTKKVEQIKQFLINKIKEK
jgi:hypothetical protein